MLRPNCNEEIEGIMSKKFIPTLETEETSDCFFFNSKAHNENNMTDLEKENDKLNKMKYLFPSIPIEKIENILKKNKAISIEEGIEQLKELTLSEKSKKKINKIEQNQFANKLNNNNLNQNINININNNNNFSLCRKFIKNLPKKRNYNTLSMTMGQSRPPAAPTRYSNININNNNNHINNSNINAPNTKNKIINNNNNNRINEHNIENNKNNNEAVVVVNEKEKRRIEERKKKELKTVNEVAKELLESRNENELKEYLFDQLQLLDKKKRIDEKYSEMKEHINKLNKDQIELRRCNLIVSRGLNKKIVEDARLGNKVKELEKEINVVRNSIRDHESIGDRFNEALKNLQNKTYFV
jgi:hypothetical protein